MPKSELSSRHGTDRAEECALDSPYARNAEQSGATRIFWFSSLLTLPKRDIDAIPPLYYAERRPERRHPRRTPTATERKHCTLWSLVFLGRERIPDGCQLVGEPGDVWLTETSVQIRTLAGWTDWEARRTSKGGFSHPYLPSDFKLSFVHTAQAFAYRRTPDWRTKWGECTPDTLRTHLHGIMGEDEESLNAATRAVNAVTKPSGKLMGYWEVGAEGVAAIVYSILSRPTPLHSDPPQREPVHMSHWSTPTPMLEEPRTPPEPERQTDPLDSSSTGYANSSSQYSVPYAVPMWDMYTCYDPRCFGNHGHAAGPSHMHSNPAGWGQQLAGPSWYPQIPQPGQSRPIGTFPAPQTCPFQAQTLVWREPLRPDKPQRSRASRKKSTSTRTQPMQSLTPPPSTSSCTSTDTLMYPSTPVLALQEISHEVEPSPRAQTSDAPATGTPTLDVLVLTLEASAVVHAAAQQAPFALVDQLLGVIDDLQSRVTMLKEQLAERPTNARDVNSLSEGGTPAAKLSTAAPPALENPAAQPAVVHHSPFVGDTQIAERGEFTDASSRPGPASPIAHDIDSDAREYDSAEAKSDQETARVADGVPPNTLSTEERGATATALRPVESDPVAHTLDHSPASVHEHAAPTSAPQTQRGFWTWMTQYWQS
ncbi:hypothetical protein PsYK624_073160 [Phanerochaete sordida]|uniref:Uncharacterized protein n=1 Tax=Phanerochaete sordida TaxID=48140 RepID=A0A9P3LEN2_9APHY|nr:hypothetical protein PsYK624_073160 [Phanerochaete sordida]